MENIDSFSNVKVKGSASHEAYQELQKQLKTINQKENDLSKSYAELYRQRDEAGMKKMEPFFDELDADRKKVYKSYLQNNAGSLIALYVLINLPDGKSM